MQPLERWHTPVPAEPDLATLERLDWQGRLEAEAHSMAEVEREVGRARPSEGLARLDRCVRSTPVWPGRFTSNWHRTDLLEPEGAPEGSIEPLHGLLRARLRRMGPGVRSW
mgnify:CR=1 FL=1